MQNNRMLIPAETYVQGVVDSVRRPGRVSGRAELLMHLTRSGKGAGIGSGIGGTAGLAAVLLSRGQDVRMEVCTIVEMELGTIARPAEQHPRYPAS